MCLVFVNLDFADVKTVMVDKGVAHIGIGKATGDDKAIDAVKQAVTSPLLETTIENATHVIINVSGDISLMEANDAASYVQELAGENANIIFGAMYDESCTDTASITVIATGLEDRNNIPVGKAMAGLARKFSNQLKQLLRIHIIVNQLDRLYQFSHWHHFQDLISQNQ